MRKTRITSLAAVGIAGAFLSALSPTTTFAAPDVSAAKDPLRPYTHQQLHWKRCDPATPATYQCTTLKVPLDYGDPAGQKLDIAVSRVKASSPQDRHGVLLLNPGGPGGEGLKLPVDVGAELPGKVKRQYDLIGFDPRGVGRSSPVSCGLTADEKSMDRPYKPETFAKDVQWARTVADKCRAKNGDKLRHLTTRNTVRDMDVLRAALGERKISYLGYSYGTYLGAVYMQMFPRRTDRFVLDSAVDPARFGRGILQDMAEGTEPAFTRWTRWTAQRHTTYHLGNTPDKVRKTFWDLVARADRKPVDSTEGPLTGDGIRAQRHKFFNARDAADWVAELKQAAGGTKPTPSFEEDTSDGSIWAVICADTARAWPGDPEQYRRDAIRDKARYPLYGDFASTIKPCAFWKPGTEPATKVNNKVKALIVQNEWDSQTPLPAAQAMHRSLHGSRMITVVGGEGHGVYPFNSCADKTATAYLATGRLPSADLTCRAQQMAQ
ncbi:alpha/beta hydrolase [Streptomyces sp. AN091965]|uniref:alpha/beta hydrolase n=1 Tax=Streptomyces sp. AN091965 TaxID=2927803 RepID=UPI0035A847AB